MARPHLRRLQLIAHQLVSPQVDPEPAAATAPATAALHDEVASFFEQGFLACPGVLSEEHVAALKADTDRYMAEAGFSAQQGADDNFEEAITPRLTQPTLAPVLGGLPSFRPVVERIRSLMLANTRVCEDALPTFSFHHQHALVHGAGAGGADWQCASPQTPRPQRPPLIPSVR